MKKSEETNNKMQKEKNQIINPVESQLIETRKRSREEKLKTTNSKLRKNNSGSECELKLIENELINNHPLAETKDNNNESLVTFSEPVAIETSLQSDLDKSIEEKKKFENETNPLSKEIQEKETNYQNLKDQWKNLLIDETQFAMLPTSDDDFFGFRWEFSSKELPDFLLETIKPTIEMNNTTTMPLMFLPPSDKCDGFLFQIYLTREAHRLLVSIACTVENYLSYRAEKKRKLCFMLFSDEFPMKSFSKDLPTEFESKYTFWSDLISIPGRYSSFNPSTGWIIAVK